MLLYITGGVGLLLSVIAIVLVLIFHAKSKPKIVPIIIYVLGLALFLGSGFLHWRGLEPEPDGKEPADGAQLEAENTAVPAGESDSDSGAAGDLGDYYVEVKGASLVKDYDGNPAVVITYAWTNNSEDTTSAEVALMAKAFQDGVQLNTAFIGDASVYNSELSFKGIRPGTTFEVQCAFELTSESSVIEFEVSELFSLSDDTVAENFDPADLG